MFVMSMTGTARRGDTLTGLAVHMDAADAPRRDEKGRRRAIRRDFRQVLTACGRTDVHDGQVSHNRDLVTCGNCRRGLS